MYLIEELWIINGISGTTLVNQKISEKFDSDLFGGFISAAQNMLKGMGESSFDHIEMGSVQMLLLSDEGGKIIFVCRSPLIAQKEVIQNYLLELKETFFNKYEKYLDSWGGDLSHFNDIKTVINIKDDPRNVI